MKKWLLGVTVFLLTGVVIAPASLCLLWHSSRVIDKMRGKVYPLEQIPARRIGLLLGAAKITPNGNPNLYFAARIAAAAELYHAGKIAHVLISGDNSRPGYDEPWGINFFSATNLSLGTGKGAPKAANFNRCR